MPDLTLPPRLDLSAANALHAQAQALTATREDCRLLAQEVSSIGTACLQTLLALDQALVDQGRRLTLVEPSQALQDGMRQLGMETVMTRWMGQA